MANYVLDTGILVGYLRASAFAQRVDRDYAPTRPPNVAVISIVTAAELRAFALRRNWGSERRRLLADLLSTIPSTPISHDLLVTAYADIHAFSQGHHPSRRLTGSAKTMGNNDIWIAATATVLNATLLTTDHDFDHLHGEFCNVVFIKPT